MPARRRPLNEPSFEVHLRRSVTTTLHGVLTTHFTDREIREYMSMGPDEVVTEEMVGEFIRGLEENGDLPDIDMDDDGDWENSETDFDIEGHHLPGGETVVPPSPPPIRTNPHPLWPAHGVEPSTCTHPLCVTNRTWAVPRP